MEVGGLERAVVAAVHKRAENNWTKELDLIKKQ